MDDAYAALRWLHATSAELGIDASRIAVSGTSAGGAMAASLCLMARDRGEFAIAFQHLDMPRLADELPDPPNPTTGEFIWRAQDSRFCRSAYLAGTTSPYASAARADDLAGLPPAYIAVGTPGFWAMDPRTGLDWLHILHGEQRLRLFASLDPAGALIGDTAVTDLADKGPGKPALLRAVKQVRTPGGTLVAEATEVWVLRGGGGFGGARDLPGEALPPVPPRDPDAEIILPTSLAQAAIYRLSGDRNPLHVDPQTARSAGLDRPILHGLSILGCWPAR
jgi:hypothetical protein